MYQQQQFHTANYRGNQQGHDQYLRADSQQPSSFGSIAGSQVASQYRGFQRSYQPTGQVQSFYGQSAQNQSVQGGQFNAQFANTNAYHTANYRGNQQGHDQYLRADATQPSNFGSQQQSAYTPSFSNVNAYHTANYRGNQQGHDQYLRADATQPSNFGIQQNQSNSSQFSAQPQQNQFQQSLQSQQFMQGQSGLYRG